MIDLSFIVVHKTTTQTCRNFENINQILFTPVNIEENAESYDYSHLKLAYVKLSLKKLLERCI